MRRTDFWPFGQEINSLTQAAPFRTTAMGYNSALRTPSTLFTGKERDAETGLDYFGARYLSSAQGRFTSPDPLNESGNPKGPQSWNRYTYVLNNPLRFIDPNGLCSAPAVQSGETGVCIDLYISAARIADVGHGDNRGPAPADPSATYRQELQLAINPTEGTVRLVKDDPGVSKASIMSFPGSPAGSPLDLTVAKKGSSVTTISPVSVDTEGNGHFSVNNEALNGLAALPGAPKDPIKTDIRYSFTPGGKVGLDSGGTRTAYPSLEVYRYDPNGHPVTILQVPERNPQDLCCRNQKIPRVSPR